MIEIFLVREGRGRGVQERSLEIADVLGVFWGPGGEGFQKVAILTPKVTSLRVPTSFEPFCVKIG